MSTKQNQTTDPNNDFHTDQSTGMNTNHDGPAEIDYKDIDPELRKTTSAEPHYKTPTSERDFPETDREIEGLKFKGDEEAQNPDLPIVQE
ncbi:MAG: hypothetical protein V4543_08750 [Bacteroidota bacterium]